jgi:SET domain-containing protein
MKGHDGMPIQVRVGRSRIAGTGVFAAQFIKKSTWVLEYTGEKISRQEATQRLAQGNIYVFFVGTDYDIDGNTPDNCARYINHSCDPNCESEIIGGSVWIIALRDIQKGEELTYDYGYELEGYEQRPCRCGATNCCGYIVDKAFRENIVPPQRRV